MAVRQCFAAGLRFLALLGLLMLAGAPAGAARNNEASESRLKRDITFLASDECEGRGPGTKGIDKAADYIAAEFKKAGLKPGGPGGSWFQPFTINLGASRMNEPAVLHLRGPQGQEIELQPGRDFEVTAGSGPGAVSAPLVFAGFGATAPGINYDDYKDLDVAGKVVVLLRRVPRWANQDAPFDGKNRDTHAGLLNKYANAERHRAAAVLLVNDASEEAGGDELLPFNFFGGGGGSIPVLHVRRHVLDPVLLSSLGVGLGALEQDINRDLKPRSTPLKGWTARLDAKVERKSVAVKNVIGVLEGSGPLAKETVVVGAHYDHLGYGPYGSLSKDRTPQIHHGADDNGSGTTSVLELARRFAEIPNRKGRRLVFMTFSGEERGLLGSRHYCKEPVFPLGDTVAMVNLDMVGRLDPQKAKLIVEGLGTAKEFEPLIDKLNEKHGFELSKQKGGTGPSDHDSFYRKNIPVFFFWTGIHKDYHRPSDTSDKINVQGMRKIADLAEEVIAQLAAEEKRPTFVAVATPFKKGQGGRTNTPRLGVQPSYEDDKEGILLDGVAKDGPAEKAGLKAGDRIIELAGRAVRNLEGMVAIMATQERGRPMDVTILRNGKKLTLKVTPQ
jgi:hypothetical protein